MKNKKTNLIILSAVFSLFILSFIPLNASAADTNCDWYETECPSDWKPSIPPSDAGKPPSGPDKYYGNLWTTYHQAGYLDCYNAEGDLSSKFKATGCSNPNCHIKCCQETFNIIYPMPELKKMHNMLDADQNKVFDYPIEAKNIKSSYPSHKWECWSYTDVFCCPPPSCEISASSTSINSGDSVILIWSSKNANSIVSSNNLNSTQELSGSITKKPTNTTTNYQLRVASSSGEQATCQTTVTVKEPPKPLPVISGPCQNLVPCKDDCKLSDIFVMIQNIVNCLVFISTIICLLFLVIGGLLYIFSLGNPENLTKAKNTILWALGGLALVFLAWLIVNTVMQFMGVGGGFLMWNSVG